jgi:predicted MPP superfamily phosphohydrolase
MFFNLWFFIKQPPYGMVFMKDIEICEYQVISDKIINNITILVLSDFHICEHLASNQLRLFSSALKKVWKNYKPDMALLAGDYVNHNPGIPYLPLFLHQLKTINSMCAVMGNHDYYTYPLWHVLLFPFVKKIKRKQIDHHAIEKIFTAHKVMLLKDDLVTLTVNQNTINVLGIDMLTYINKSQIPPFNVHEGLNILLSHHPDMIKYYPGNTIDLMAAGHTHGGVFVWKNNPLYKGTSLPLKKPYGIHMMKGKILIITKGIGRQYSHYLGNTPDITIIQVMKSRGNIIKE